MCACLHKGSTDAKLASKIRSRQQTLNANQPLSRGFVKLLDAFLDVFFDGEAELHDCCFWRSNIPGSGV